MRVLLHSIINIAYQGGKVKLEFDFQRISQIKCVLLELFKLEIIQHICSQTALHYYKFNLVCAKCISTVVYLRKTFWGLSECEEDVLTVFLTSLPLDREEMKSLQAALQKQLDEANERAEKQQATVRQS